MPLIDMLISLLISLFRAPITELRHKVKYFEIEVTDHHGNIFTESLHNKTHALIFCLCSVEEGGECHELKIDRFYYGKLKYYEEAFSHFFTLLRGATKIWHSNV
ncbi:uncharacterized protein TRIADDRAFT_58698 [Trichoplax adhaerens]|uniref:Uncharacterized protein n=1 Tax=Trichoplax adhaerens TaxID=10228 RepID=B3S3F4_TRIAD|nr:predicted protein [Trichoplax adhaerens]EDV22783.1 predicted protein [Trichoplax adhaerens]|eukprot:XP_002114649.1 predicted protein [Trichoplax adhaerens]